MFELETIITVGGYLGITAIIFVESGLFFGFFLLLTVFVQLLWQFFL